MRGRSPCALVFIAVHTASPQDTAIAIGSSSEEEEGGAGPSGVRRGEAGAGAAAAGTRHSLRTTVVCLDEGGEMKDAQRFKVWGKCGGGREGDLMPPAFLSPPVQHNRVQLFTLLT